MPLFGLVLLAAKYFAGCQSCGGSEELHGPYHFTPLPWSNQRPINDDMVRRARAHVGDVGALRASLSKAIAGKSLHVVVIGGSVTAGAQCVDPATRHESIACGWPARFKNWLDAAFPKGSPHVVENLSERASSSIVATELLSPHRQRLAATVDIIIIDYAVNDASNPLRIQRHLYQAVVDSEERTRSAMLNYSWPAAGPAPMCSALSGDYRNRLLVGTERLVRWCISLPSRPAVMFFETFNPSVAWQRQAQEVHLTVASYYQLPVISYRDAVWHLWRNLGSAHRSSPPRAEAAALCEEIGLAPACAGALWGSSLHPPWHVHQLLADLLALSVAYEFRLMCSSKSSSPLNNRRSEKRPTVVAPLYHSNSRCSSPLTIMSTLRTTAFLPTILPASRNGWSLEEDVPGKPGWIARSDGAEISFDMHFQHGDLTIGFLRSYNGLSSAAMWVSDSASRVSGEAVGKLSVAGEALQNAPLRLNGLWNEAKSELSEARLSGLGQGRLRIHLRSTCDDVPHCKFKLLMLTSC